MTSDCTAPKEDITLSEPSDFEAYAGKLVYIYVHVIMLN